jgi:23S rRNA (guanosine2251-2'-O)-methyltransferase
MVQIIYGIHPVNEALRSSSLQIERIFIGSPKPSPSLQSVVELARQKRVPVIPSRKEALERMARGGVHQDVVAILKEALYPYADLEQILTLEKGKEKRLILILDSIQDPQNFGSLIRTALGCGAHGIIIPKDRAVGITPAVTKASAGAAAHLPVARVVNLAAAIDKLKEKGFWVFGAAGESKDLIYDLDLTTDVAIVVGSEGKGIRPLVRKKCDQLFSIPMKGPVSSFNASVSGGMVLYEVMRQRHMKSKHQITSTK